MTFEDDFRATLRELAERRIPSMVVGALAREQYGLPRTTWDIDIRIQLEGEPDKDARKLGVWEPLDEIIRESRDPEAVR